MIARNTETLVAECAEALVIDGLVRPGVSRKTETLVAQCAEALVIDGLVRPREAAKFLGTSEAFVRKMMRNGALAYVRLNATSDQRIPRLALVQFAARGLVVREDI